MAPSYSSSGGGVAGAGGVLGEPKVIKYPRTGKRGAPQAFPRKLFEILCSEPRDVIGWTEGGTSFLIKDMDTFVVHVLMKYFRHQKYSSFQRQLNLYGFRKVSKGSDVGAYAHKYFLEDRNDLLVKVRRMPQASTSVDRASSSAFTAAASTGTSVNRGGGRGRNQASGGASPSMSPLSSDDEGDCPLKKAAATAGSGARRAGGSGGAAAVPESPLPLGATSGGLGSLFSLPFDLDLGLDADLSGGGGGDDDSTGAASPGRSGGNDSQAPSAPAGGTAAARRGRGGRGPVTNGDSLLSGSKGGGRRARGAGAANRRSTKGRAGTTVSSSSAAVVVASGEARLVADDLPGLTALPDTAAQANRDGGCFVGFAGVGVSAARAAATSGEGEVAGRPRRRPRRSGPPAGGLDRLGACFGGDGSSDSAEDSDGSDAGSRTPPLYTLQPGGPSLSAFDGEDPGTPGPMAITMEPGRPVEQPCGVYATAAPVAVPVTRAYPIAEAVPTAVDGKLDRLRVTGTEAHALAYREATKLGEALCASPNGGGGLPGRLDVVASAAFGLGAAVTGRRARSDSVSSDDWGPYDGLGGSLRDVPSFSGVSSSFAGVGVGGFGSGGVTSMLGGVDAMDLTLGPGDLDGLFHPEKICVPLVSSINGSDMECAPTHASMAR